MISARGASQDLCNREAMDEAVDSLNRLAAWFGKIIAISNDGYWRLGHLFSTTNVVECKEQTQFEFRPMAVIDFADDRAGLETNPFYTSLRQLGLTLSEPRSLSPVPYARVYVSVDTPALVKAIPDLCDDIISKRTSYITESDYRALKKDHRVSPTFFNKPPADSLSVKYWQALCISKRDYLRLLQIEVWRKDWESCGDGLFGKIVPSHIQKLRDCVRTIGNVEEQFDRVKHIIQSIPDDEDRSPQSSPRHPKVSKLYKRLKWEIKTICERIEERKPSPSNRGHS